MKKIILASIMLMYFFSAYAQQNPLQYTDKEWQTMMTHLEKKCELVRLSVDKKYKKRKIKKDLRVVKALNEMMGKSYLTQSIIENILKKCKVKIHLFPTLMNNGKSEYIQYSLIGGYMEPELYLTLKNDGSAYRLSFSMDNSDYTYRCEEMGDAPLLNFHYVYQYLRPNAKFQIGFTGYEGGFVSEIKLNKSS